MNTAPIKEAMSNVKGLSALNPAGDIFKKLINALAARINFDLFLNKKRGKLFKDKTTICKTSQ